MIVNAPAVFRYTAPTNPERHLQAASMLGADTSKAKASDAGAVLSDTILRYMHALDVPDGLSALGYVLVERARATRSKFSWQSRSLQILILGHPEARARDAAPETVRQRKRVVL